MLNDVLNNILRSFSKAIIKKYQPEVVGITGSVGKTSAKEAIAAVLRSRFSIRDSHKNYNNEVGLPLTIIGVEKTPGRSIFGWLAVFTKAAKLLIKKDFSYPKMLVLEMGADKPGDIQYLVDIAPCKVGVLTFISHAHTEAFKNIKKIAQEKRVIISHLAPGGFAVLNLDNEMVIENAETVKANRVTYGLKDGADIRATDINLFLGDESGRPMGLNFKVSYKGSFVPVFLPGIINSRFVSAGLAGIAVGTIFGINLVEAAEALQNIDPLPGHMCPIAGIKQTLVVDDTYNSSPEAAKAALETLAQIKVKETGERYAVLGDMLELGEETENSHREVGFKVAELGIDFLITVGEASKITAAAAHEAGLEEHRVASFNNSTEAGRFIQEKLKIGDVILVKGSQGSRMEKIVKEIMAEPLDAKNLLVRQDEYWLQK